MDIVRQSILMELITQGTPASASRVRLTLQDVDDFGQTKDANRHFAVRALAADLTTYTSATNATIALVTRKGTQVTEHTANKDYTWRSYSGQKNVDTLTIGGVVTDGEYVTIGSRVYEFDTNNSITTGRVRVNIASYATASQGTLTIATQPSVGDTMTIGTRTYAFVANGTANNAGEISVGSDKAAAQANIKAAINGTDSVNSAHSLVSCATFAADAAVLTALVPGVGGDAIVTTETFAATGNVFDAATLGTTTAGVSCTAANAVTALAAAINADSSATFSAADGAGDTVVVTADSVGDAGNLTCSENTANCTWAATTTGYDALPGVIELDLDSNDVAETFRLMLLQAVTPVAAVCDWSSQILEITHTA